MSHRSRAGRTLRHFRRRLSLALFSSRGRLASLALLAYVGYVALFFLVTASEARNIVTGVAYILFSAIAISASFIAWRRRGLDGRMRKAWLILALSVTTISAASAFLFLYELVGGARPSVSIADLLNFAFYALFLVGVLSLSATPRGRAQLVRLALDTGTVMIAGGAVVWLVVLAPALSAQSALGAGEWLAFAWPVLDLTLLCGATLVLLDSSGGRKHLTLQLIALAAMAMFAGDLILAGSLVRTGSYSSGEHANLLWLLSAVFWTNAAQSVRREPTISLKTTQEFSVDETLTRMSMLPYLAMAVSYGLLAFVGLRQQDGEFQVMLGAALLTTALVVTRQFIVLRENVRLLAERAALQRELSRQVVQDPVTELATRTHFQNRVKQALRRSHLHPERVAVMFLDLDDFKDVNDSFGHDKGDLLLREVALRLMHSTRGSDLVARLGGDEFAILVDRVLREEDLAIMANRIISSIAAPFDLEGSEVLTGMSIGIARADGGMNADDLIGNADVAMYDAKQKGKGQFTFFKGEMQRAVYNRLTLESDLRRAVAGDEISLLYQPIVDMRNGAIVAVEALARWRHPTRGMLGPEQFIPLAEESGMMIPLGRLLLFVACSEAARWSKIAPGKSPAVAVNISSRQLQHHGLADDVRAVLGTSRLPSEKLILEMTENVAVRDTQLTMQRLVGFKALGVRLAIDNFGSGFSSIAELQRLPIDMLKMDKSFVRAAGRSESGRALARTIISLGKALGLETIAEGVESETEAQLLLGMGCHVAQGYHYSMPVPAEEIGRMIAEAPGPTSALTG